MTKLNSEVEKPRFKVAVIKKEKAIKIRNILNI